VSVDTSCIVLHLINFIPPGTAVEPENRWLEPVPPDLEPLTALESGTQSHDTNSFFFREAIMKDG